MSEPEKNATSRMTGVGVRWNEYGIETEQPVMCDSPFLT